MTYLDVFASLCVRLVVVSVAGAARCCVPLWFSHDGIEIVGRPRGRGSEMQIKSRLGDEIMQSRALNPSHHLTHCIVVRDADERRNEVPAHIQQNMHFYVGELFITNIYTLLVRTS